MAYTITIDGVDRVRCVAAKSVTISDESQEKASSASFRFTDQDNLGEPARGAEVIITKDGTRLFGGIIMKKTLNQLSPSDMIYTISCIDFTRELHRRRVVESYDNMTDKEIIEDIVARYCAGLGITTTNVVEGITIQKITFNYLTPAQCIQKIAGYSNRTWYIDYYKDIHYFAAGSNPSPFNIDATTFDVKGLNITKDETDIRNRVFVRGGTYLSDEVTISYAADGEQTVFNLPEKPHDFAMTVGGVSKTVGIKNVNTTGFDYYLNYQEKYVEEGTGTPPAEGTVMSFTFKYDIPVLVAVEDAESIEEVGVFEYPIFDNSIQTQQDARDRAAAEITDYASTIVDGSFETLTDGFRAGQDIAIDLPGMGIDDTYLVQKVVAKSMGAGMFKYTITLASTRKLGIIAFLLRLLENDKNFLDIDPNEVVDELFTPDGQVVQLTDTLQSSDLGARPYEWGTFKWGLSEWGP
jgi:hypothetical protein